MEVSHQHTSGPLPAAVLDDPRLDELAAWGRRLAELGISPGASGNLSCRTKEGFLISATGVPLNEITPEHWVEVTGITPLADGGLRVDSRGSRDPSRDAGVHAAIYGRVADADAVFHLHPEYLETLTTDLAVPATAEYRTAGTVESVREIERWIDPETPYLVIVEHGIVAWAGTVEEAGAIVERYHRAATGG